MQNTAIQAQMALSRSQQNLVNLHTMIHVFGHQDEGGFDDLTLESISAIIELLRKEIDITERLLETIIREEDSATPENSANTGPHLKIIK